MVNRGGVQNAPDSGRLQSDEALTPEELTILRPLIRALAQLAAKRLQDEEDGSGTVSP